MMQKEFEELTGVIVSNSEYASIEKEYAVFSIQFSY